MIDACFKLAKLEGLDDLSKFIKPYQTFEEIPLISRYEHLKHITGFIPHGEEQAVFNAMALFWIQSILFFAKKNLTAPEFAEFFCGITFPDLEQKKELGFVIPNILVTRRKELFRFLLETPKIFNEKYAGVISSFRDIGVDTGQGFAFYASRPAGQSEEAIERLYAIPLFLQNWP